jgi:hypothetical protein
MLLIGDNDPGDSYAANGLICLNNVVPRTYVISESAAPAGYRKDRLPRRSPPRASRVLGERRRFRMTRRADATFVNTPLSKITVTFESLAGAGVPVASIECPPEAADPTPDPTPDPSVLDDTSERSVTSCREPTTARW